MTSAECASSDHVAFGATLKYGDLKFKC